MLCTYNTNTYDKPPKRDIYYYIVQVPRVRLRSFLGIHVIRIPIKRYHRASIACLLYIYGMIQPSHEVVRSSRSSLLAEDRLYDASIRQAHDTGVTLLTGRPEHGSASMMMYISEPYLKARIRKFVGGQRWKTFLPLASVTDIKQTPSNRQRSRCRLFARWTAPCLVPNVSVSTFISYHAVE